MGDTFKILVNSAVVLAIQIGVILLGGLVLHLLDYFDDFEKAATAVSGLATLVGFANTCTKKSCMIVIMAFSSVILLVSLYTIWILSVAATSLWGMGFARARKFNENLLYRVVAAIIGGIFLFAIAVGIPGIVIWALEDKAEFVPSLYCAFTRVTTLTYCSYQSSKIVNYFMVVWTFIAMGHFVAAAKFIYGSFRCSCLPDPSDV